MFISLLSLWTSRFASCEHNIYNMKSSCALPLASTKQTLSDTFVCNSYSIQQMAAKCSKLIYYLFIPLSRSLLKTLIDAHLVQVCHSFNGIHLFIIMFNKFIGTCTEPDEASLYEHSLSPPLSHLHQRFPNGLFILMRYTQMCQESLKTVRGRLDLE